MTSTNKSPTSSLSSEDVSSSNGIDRNPPANSGPGEVPTHAVEQETPPVRAALFLEPAACPHSSTSAAAAVLSPTACAVCIQETAAAAVSLQACHADSLLSSILMTLLLSCCLGRGEAHHSCMKTVVEAFFKVYDIETEGDLPIVSSDDCTFDFDLNPVRNITKPVQVGLPALEGG